MTPWSFLLEACQGALFTLTQFYGGQLGAAILSLSVLVRLAFLPLSLRAALGARRRARVLGALKPRLQRIKAAHAGDPERLSRDTLAAFERAGVSPIDVGSLKVALLQAPVMMGLFHAVRSAVAGSAGQGALWIASLARPDVAVAAIAALLFGAAATLAAPEQSRGWVASLPALSVGVMALMTSAGFGLYLVGSGTVGLLQALLVVSRSSTS